MNRSLLEEGLNLFRLLKVDQSFEIWRDLFLHFNSFAYSARTSRESKCHLIY